MCRARCCSKDSGLNRGPWNSREDMILREYVTLHGEGKWSSLPEKAGLKRCGKSCRLRWINYLRPDIKRGNISADEEELIIRLHGLLGNRWSLIAGRLPRRTDNEIKNFWNAHLSKKLANNGTDVVLKISPVRPKAVRISKGGNKHGDGGNLDEEGFELQTDGTKITNASRASWEFFMDELISGIDLEFNGISMTKNIDAKSISMDGNGQQCSVSESNLVEQRFPYSGPSSRNEHQAQNNLFYSELFSPDCSLFSSPLYSTDSGFHGFTAM